MKNWLRKCAAIASAAVMTAVSTSSVVPALAADNTEFPFTIEGEDMEGATLWTDIYNQKFPGYSGEGFTYLTGGALSFNVTVPEDGMYQLKVRGVQILDAGGRQQTVAINGVEYSSVVPYYDTWTDIDFGTIRLKAGENEISFLNKYGYLAIDYATVEKAVFPDITQADSVPCDAEATDETKALMKYLHSVYGSHMLSGQQEIYGGGHKVQTTIRYDNEKDICVDQEGKEYVIDRDSADVDKDGNKFYWHCSDNVRTYTYDTQNRNYNYDNYDQEFDYIADKTGKYPAIRGFDFMNYNPLYGWDDGTTERVIEWAKERNGIATACWHINIPSDFDNYTVGEAVDWSLCTYKPNHQFSIENAVKEGTKENDYLNLAIADLAEQFLKIQEAGVPILWRPFHEAEGNPSSTDDPIDGSGSWFWWSQDGAVAYKELWKYLYDKLTNEYGIHNLIWQQNLYAWSDISGEWYAGDDYVDIVGFDKYDTQYNRHDGLTSGPNESCNSEAFWPIVKFANYKKMAAIMENSTIPSVSNIETEQANWLYFCTWYDNGQENFISGDDYNNVDSVIEMYQSDLCITLDELPTDLYKFSGSSEGTTKPTATTTTTTGAPADTTTTTAGETVYGDANCDGKVEIADATLILQTLTNKDEYQLSEQGLINADVIGNGDGVTGSDALTIQQVDAGIYKVTDLPIKE